MNKKFLRSIATATSASIAMISSPAWADTTDDLLQTLLAKGILTQAEYDRIAARAKPDPLPADAAPTIAVAPLGQTPQQAISALADEGRFVRMTDKGVGVEMAGVTLKLSGQINGFYARNMGKPASATTTVVGGLASFGSGTSAVRNGLLPGFLKVEATTNQGGWDVGAHFGIFPGINSVSGQGGANSFGSSQAFATSGIDFRQTYLTFGKPNLGEIKIGRDIGLFAAGAILNDITLFSVGSSGNNAAPSNTSLGRIGLGYIYADFQPQITYTSPKFHGFHVAAGIFQPLVSIGNTEVNATPGFQGKISYDFVTSGVAARLWVSGISQKHDGVAGSPSYTGRAFDVGAKLGYGPAVVTGYYYGGNGVGTTGLFLLSTAANGRTRDSHGYYLQGTYDIGKLTLGASYGASFLDLAPGEINPTLLDSNASWVAQARYGLTPWATLVAEYVTTTSTAQGPNAATSDTLATGAILSF